MRSGTVFVKCCAASFCCIQVLLAATLTVAPSGGTYTSIQTAVNTASAGDTILVDAGVYNEGVSFSKSGSAAGGYITLLGKTGAIIDGTGKGELGIAVTNVNYLKIIGLEIRNVKGSGTPIGISVEGSSSNLEIRNNKVHAIENASGNAHGIALYGTSPTPITNILVDGNEISNCKLGQSESMVLNGNVTNFTVSNNIVHDNDNIGIDFIGFEGTGPSGSDQARNGSCFGNHVYNISSAANPTYNGERSADGIYVDGGRDIIIERNIVDNCDIGIEVASEHSGKSTSAIVVRSNFVSRSFQGNIMSGGYASNKGNASNITIVNNTLYLGTDGAIVLQFNNNGIAIKNNICYGDDYLVQSGSNNTGVVADNNLYFGGSTSSPGAWSDPHAHFANPLLINPPADLHVQATSPAKNSGVVLPDSLIGTLDIDGQARVEGNSIDIGADESGSASRAQPFCLPAIHSDIRMTHDRQLRTIRITGIPLNHNSPIVVRVYGLAGRCERIATAERTGDVSVIDCSGYPAGMYLFSIGSGSKEQLQPFTIY